MEWREEGIVLSIRRHGESSALLELFTRNHGRHMGLVRGGRSRRMRSALQPGNGVLACWRGRLDEHLGIYTIELATARAARVIDDGLGLAGLSSLCSLAGLVAEREAHPRLYDASKLVLDAIAAGQDWLPLMARWELGLLDELGFGLDLERCAATGSSEELIYVSPKSARAVSRAAGHPYRDRLLPLPAFLINSDRRHSPSADEVRAALELTGFFLRRHVFDPRGTREPVMRQQILAGSETGQYSP